MSDLISKQDAINALVEKGQSSKRYKLGEIWELNLPEIIDAIDALPSAEPERKTVKVEKFPLECFDGVLVVISGHCDCGTLVFNDQRYKYCPHCGARLEWDESC